MPGRDTRTRFQGVFARHQEGCGVEGLPPGAQLGDIANACSCEPTYYGTRYDETIGRNRKTKRFRLATEARAARGDLGKRIQSGELAPDGGRKLGDAIDRFVKDAKTGVALNKRGTPYKRSAYVDLESALKHLPHDLRRRPIRSVRGGDLQRLVDKLVQTKTRRGDTMSGSRVRSVINAI